MIEILTAEGIAEWNAYARTMTFDSKDKYVFKGISQAFHRFGATVFGFRHEGKLISINATYFGRSKRKNAWGRYVNNYEALTLPPYRRQHFALTLARHVEAKAIAEGYSRLRSLAGSWMGVAYHVRQGHEMWGISPKGHEIIVDTRLCPVAVPNGVPERARSIGPDLFPMETKHIQMALEGGIFRVSPDQARILTAHYEQYRVARVDGLCCLNVESPSYPPEFDEYVQCGCNYCLKNMYAVV